MSMSLMILQETNYYYVRLIKIAPQHYTRWLSGWHRCSREKEKYFCTVWKLLIEKAAPE